MSIQRRWFGIGSLTVFGAVAIAACNESDTPTVAANDAAVEASPAVDAADASDATADAEPTCTTLAASYGSKSCNDCMMTACCGVITTCESDPECKAIQTCTLACFQGPDAGACYQGCLDDHPAGKAKWDVLYACWFNDPPKCGVACT